MSSTSTATSSAPELLPLERAPASARELRPVAEHEWSALIDWLDDSLRGGRQGRLRAEYPMSLQHDHFAAHRVIWSGHTPLAHAMFHIVELRAPSPLRVGMIGLVYTEPEARGKGLAKRCIESCLEALEEREVPIALLWSDKPEFYARLDFHPVGEERSWLLNAELCRAARRTLGSRVLAGALPVGPAKDRDWPALEALYARKRFRAVRPPRALQKLAAAPDTRLVVARRGRRAVAYAALGRGDDFQGVVHEWAGPPREVISCFESLCTESGPLLVHAGPEHGVLADTLEQSGVQTFRGPLGLGRKLDPHFELPSSFYLWGFDSI